MSSQEQQPRSVKPAQPRRAPPPPSQYAPRRPESRPVRESGWYLPWWSLVVLVGVVGLVALGLLYMFGELSQPNTPGDQPARIQVVTSQPTLSQDFLAGGENTHTAPPTANVNPTVIPEVLPSPTVSLPTPIPSPTLPAGDFALGVQVEVVGVDVSGLNIRAEPGYDGAPRFLAAENDLFVIIGGPQDADGLEWWQLEDPDDPQRYGWAARNYLTIVTP